MLPVDALVRSVEMNQDTPHAFFLGAGTSIAGGIPDAETCLWQWKRDIYRSHHPGLNGQLMDVSLPETRVQIETWLDGAGRYPSAGSVEEYGFFAEACYPIADDRRQYFQRLAEGGKPTIGHHLLCKLAEADIVQSVWTTNFDGLVLRACASHSITPIEVTLDTAERVQRPPRRGELLHVALHGEYRYTALKNTSEEVREQDKMLRDALIEQARTHTLIVSGYSGRDGCIMETFQRAYSQPGAGRLYWCGYLDEQPNPAVLDLLMVARQSGHIAYYVPTQGFDDLLKRLALHCLRDVELAIFDPSQQGISQDGGGD